MWHHIEIVEQIHPLHQFLWDQPCSQMLREFFFSQAVEHARWCYSASTMIGNTGALTGGEHFSIERCSSTYSFIHSVKRNRLNVNREKILVYVHYNLLLLSHYCEQAKKIKDLMVWDKNLEEDNLEDGVLYLKQLQDALI